MASFMIHMYPDPRLIVMVIFVVGPLTLPMTSMVPFVINTYHTVHRVRVDLEI